MEHAIIILGREDEIVLAILLYYIVVPHLLLSPWHILYIENHTMIGYFTFHHIVHRENMIVFHLEVTAIIVEAFAAVPVMRWVNIQATVKHIGRWICHIILREQISCFHCYLIFKEIDDIILRDSI